MFAFLGNVKIIDNKKSWLRLTQGRVTWDKETSDWPCYSCVVDENRQMCRISSKELYCNDSIVPFVGAADDCGPTRLDN